MSIRCLAPLMVVLMTTTASQAEDRAKKSDVPALEFTLEIDGKSIDLIAGENAAIDIGGRKLPIKLVPKPDRLFTTDGISFRFPREFNYAIDRETPAITIHTFSGDDTVLIFQQSNLLLDLERYRKQLIDEVVTQLGRKTKVETVKISLGGKEFNGTRILAVFAGQSIRQDVYTFTTGGKPSSLVIQVTSPTREEREETKATIELLSRTTQIKP
jgi:hypothetical protein